MSTHPKERIQNGKDNGPNYDKYATLSLQEIPWWQDALHLSGDKLAMMLIALLALKLESASNVFIVAAVCITFLGAIDWIDRRLYAANSAKRAQSQDESRHARRSQATN